MVEIEKKRKLRAPIEYSIQKTKVANETAIWLTAAMMIEYKEKKIISEGEVLALLVNSPVSAMAIAVSAQTIYKAMLVGNHGQL